MDNEAEKNLTFHSPSAMMAVWIDNLAQERNWGDHQEKMLITVDYAQGKLQHIKISDREEKDWAEHWRRKKTE